MDSVVEKYQNPPSVKSFLRLVDAKGVRVLFHKESLGTYCPCRTEQGFRDPEKHLAAQNLVSGFTISHDNPIIIGNTIVYYYVYPIIASEDPNNSSVGMIGPPSIISTIDAASYRVTLNINILPILGDSLRAIRIFRSVGNLDSFEQMPDLAPTSQQWNDISDIGSLGIVGDSSHFDIPVCNDDGIIPVIDERTIKGFVQPAFISSRSISNQFITQAFGQIQADDHFGFFPMTYKDEAIDFSNWSDAGSDWVEFNDMRFLAITQNVAPAPDNASVSHHWEVALRRINRDR